jgi:hypothetical protein
VADLPNPIEEDKRDTISRQNEFRRLQEKLDSGEIFTEKTARKRKIKQDPFTKLCGKINEFKKVHLGRESELSQILVKIEMDKSMLIREKP